MPFILYGEWFWRSCVELYWGGWEICDFPWWASSSEASNHLGCASFRQGRHLVRLGLWLSSSVLEIILPWFKNNNDNGCDYGVMKAVPLISSEVKVLFKKVSIFPSSLLMLRVNNGFLTSVPQTFFLGRIFLPSSPLNILSFSLRTLLF